MTLQRNDLPVTIPPDRLLKLVDHSGRMTDAFATFLEIVAERVPIYGSGSPEGQFEANQGRLYVDVDGTAGNRIWMKTTNGDKTGWQVA